PGVLALRAMGAGGGGVSGRAAPRPRPAHPPPPTALVENGRRAIRLVTGAALLLLVAGALEGFVSPIEWWPIEGKLAVSGLTLVLLYLYLRPPKARATTPRAT
ncbi:MAG: hypothetical protein ACHQQR_08885, partial [Gemmatimonadales bacterium]